MSRPSASPTASSPSTPSSSATRLPLKCICELAAIKNQLQKEDPLDRFQCLAFFRYGRTSELHRCGRNSSETTNRPNLYNSAKHILLKNSITSVDWLIVVRILFCETHSIKKAFNRYSELLLQHWKDDNGPDELNVLDEIRKAFGMPPQMPSDARVENKGTQSYQAGRTSLGPERPLEHSTSSRRHTRSQSNPPLLQNDLNHQVSQDPGVEARTTEDNVLSHGSSSSVSSFAGRPLDFHCPVALNSFTSSLPLRLSMDGMPSEPPLPTTFNSSNEAEAASSAEPEYSVEVANTALEVAPPTSPPDSGEPVIPLLRNNLPQSEWKNLSPLPPRRTYSQALVSAMGSRDDTFVEQLTEELNNAAPTPYEPPRLDEIPAPALNNENMKERSHFSSSRIDGLLREAALKDVAREGSVYILKAPKYFANNYPGKQALVKIGMTTHVKARIATLKRECGLDDLEQVEDVDDLKIPHYEKLETLVLSELTNFRVPFKCGKCKAEHGEWFEVSEEVALQVVRRWRKFIMIGAYGENGKLLDHWSQKFLPRNMPWQVKEDYDDHESRNRRWTHWLEEGIKETRRLEYYPNSEIL